MRILALLLLLIPLKNLGQNNVQIVTLPFESNLIPEGIAVDSDNERIFINSIKHSKIVQSDFEGRNHSNFIQPGEFGYLQGFGMTIAKDTLYALGNMLPKSTNRSILLLLDKNTGKHIRSYTLKDAGFVYLNDIAISHMGDIYITDSESSDIYTIDAKTNQLRVFVSLEDLKHSNGIAISEDGTYLYFASYTTGIRVLHIPSKSLVNKPNNYKGIDGLKFHNKTLIGIVNGRRDFTLNGIYQYQLSPDLNEITQAEKFASFENEADLPTTFDIHNDRMYYVSDSQLRNLDQETNSIMDASKLKSYQLVIRSLKNN